MKFLHLSDLHIGKTLADFPLEEDQRFIFGEILKIADSEKADAVIIAGDVYDKAVPPAYAVQLADEFLTALSEPKIPVFVISGNHDSAERVAYGGKLFARTGIYVSPVFDGCTEPIVINDDYGEVCVYLLPFIKPANVRRIYPDFSGETFTDAIRFAIGKMNVDSRKRNIIVAHQFVTGASGSGSEEISAGGLENVECSVFEPFDYAALGHIHRAQSVVRETVRYCGTPLKYSAAEALQEKSVTVAELFEKGHIEIKTVPLHPMRDLKDLRGTFDEMINGENPRDFVRITLTDELPVFNAHGRLRALYPFMTELNFDNERTRRAAENVTLAAEERTPEECFADFYEMMNGAPLPEDGMELVKSIMDEMREQK